MSLLHAVDEAVEMCKAEESRLTENTRRCKEILGSMRVRVTETSEPDTTAALGTKHADVLPEEKEEIELLERVLKKALKIRGASEAHKDGKHPNEKISKGLVNYTVKEEDKRNLVKSPSDAHKKAVHRGRAGGNVADGAPRTGPVLVRRGPVVRGRPIIPKISSARSQQKVCVKAEESSEDNSPSVSASGEDGKVATGSVRPKEKWTPSPSLPAWRTQRTKQKRLWKKVLAQQSKPVPERTKFTERLRDAFPSECPSASPADIAAELDALAQRCLDLTHCFSAELQARKDFGSGSHAWGRKMKSCRKTEACGWKQGGREMSNGTIRILPRMTPSSSRYSSESLSF
ncbi:uncharacterized protein LOC122341056 [Puntigrus tetrazona]|uniref:uncharacterized protein LOC122341056 n=1 Tax=Puntigrus tetrazona TaxID=1606681 RepID=UPI001C8A4152|nr:uncharacterized protein LOC122341056 [Puntigrus tetrazona]